MADRKSVDWEAIEREFRAGQLSVREIGRKFGITDTAIRKRAKIDGWTRPLSDKVREAVREKLVRADGSQGGSHPQRADDARIVDTASTRGFEVLLSHRRDLEQLHGLKRVLAGRLSTYLQGGAPDGPCLGEKESPGDLLEKLSRVTARLLPLERQAFSLDEPNSLVLTGAVEVKDVSARELLASQIAELASRGRPKEVSVETDGGAG